MRVSFSCSMVGSERVLDCGAFFPLFRLAMAWSAVGVGGADESNRNTLIAGICKSYLIACADQPLSLSVSLRSYNCKHCALTRDHY